MTLASEFGSNHVSQLDDLNLGHGKLTFATGRKGSIRDERYGWATARRECNCAKRTHGSNWPKSKEREMRTLLWISLAVIVLAAPFSADAADEPNTPGSPQSLVKTPLKIDPAHPPRIGDAYYPPESKRAHEEGKCLVNVTVQADGSTRDVSIAKSSGYPRLDRACLNA